MYKLHVRGKELTTHVCFHRIHQARDTTHVGHLNSTGTSDVKVNTNVLWHQMCVCVEFFFVFGKCSIQCSQQNVTEHKSVFALCSHDTSSVYLNKSGTTARRLRGNRGVELSCHAHHTADMEESSSSRCVPLTSRQMTLLLIVYLCGGEHCLTHCGHFQNGTNTLFHKGSNFQTVHHLLTALLSTLWFMHL